MSYDNNNEDFVDGEDELIEKYKKKLLEDQAKDYANNNGKAKQNKQEQEKKQQKKEQKEGKKEKDNDKKTYTINKYNQGIMMKNLIYDTFEIVDRKSNIITLKGQSNQKKYKVEIISGYVERYAPGRFVMARIFQWGNYYRFAGITKIKIYHNNKNFPNGIITPEMVEQIQDYFEKKYVKDAESIIISKRSTLSGMLNKFPYWWIDGISASLLLNKKGKKKEKVKRIVQVLVNSQRLNDLVNNTLPKDSQQALLFIKKKGGVIKYKEIIKKYPDDINIDWEKDPPNSPIGLLRRHGLVIVGRMLINNRFYKVVLIPKEILEKLSL